MSDISVLCDRADSSDSKNNEQDERLSQLEADIKAIHEKDESQDESLKNLSLRMASIEGLFEELKAAVAGAGSGGGDVSSADFEALKKLVEELQKQLHTTDSTANRALDATDSNKAEIDELKNRLDTMQLALDLLRNELDKKVDSEDFNIRIGQLQPGDGPSEPLISAHDLKMLKELGARMEALEKQVNDHIGETENRFKKQADDIKFVTDQLAGRLTENERQIADIYNELAKFKNRLKELKGQSSGSPGEGGPSVDAGKLSKLTRRVEALEDIVKGLGDGAGKKVAADIAAIWEAIQSLKDELEALRNLLNSKMSALDGLLASKADTELVFTIEARLLEKIQQMADILGKKFADRNKTKKALKDLEFQLRKILEFIMSKREGDDAMLSRKPLGGYSCASCEKGLEQLLGRKADHQPWNRMPYRDPADRIARVGPGFSRMLSTVQPELLSNRSKKPHMQGSPGSAQFHPEEDINSEFVNLPPVKKTKKNKRPMTSANS